jgi:hypothetical protein
MTFKVHLLQIGHSSVECVEFSSLMMLVFTGEVWPLCSLIGVVSKA